MAAMSPALRPSLALAGLLLAACGAGDAPREARRPSLILVSIDSLRPDHLGCYGHGRDTSPFLDSLADRGVRFESAVSTTSWTLPSHASLFTGLLGPTHGLVDNGLSLSPDHLTLAELLAGEGYETAGFFGGPYLHPTFGLGQGFTTYRSCMGTTPDDAGGAAVRTSAMAPDAPSHRDVTGPRTRERVREWAASRAEPDAPYFLFLHLWDVHYDFVPPEEYAALFVDPAYDGPADGRLMTNDAIRPGMSARDLDHVKALYDAEIRFTDDVLRGIVADLEGLGMMEDTALVVTADHGEEFLEHGQKGHNKTLFDEVLRVPLIVVWEGRVPAGRVVADQVQLVDLMPTLAAMAGFRGEVPGQGRDLAPLLTGGAMPARDALSGLFIDGRSLRALRSNERKVIRLEDGGPSALVDLVANPQEDFRRMIYPDTPGGQERLRRGAEELERAARRAEELRVLLDRRPPDAIELPPGMLEELRGLGYIGEEE
jgi:arylsulfatase A-like enzyme